jgi:thioredoxin 1
MATIVDVNADNFAKEVLEAEPLVVVEFYSPACAFCKRFEPIFSSLAERYDRSAKFCRLNVIENRQLALQYNIFGIPATLIFRGGEPIERLSGLVSEAEAAKHIDDALQ